MAAVRRSSSPTRHFVVLSVVDRLGYERCLHCAAGLGLLLPALERSDPSGYPDTSDPNNVVAETCEGCRDRFHPADAADAERLAMRAVDAVQSARTQPERDSFLVLADYYWGLA